MPVLRPLCHTWCFDQECEKGWFILSRFTGQPVQTARSNAWSTAPSSPMDFGDFKHSQQPLIIEISCPLFFLFNTVRTPYLESRCESASRTTWLATCLGRSYMSRSS